MHHLALEGATNRAYHACRRRNVSRRTPQMRLRIVGSLFIVAMLASTLAAQNQNAIPNKFNEATVAQLQAAMSSGHLTSEELTKYYLTHIIGLD